MPKPNFTAAFVLFSKGKPLDVVAAETGIPEPALLKHARDEKWNLLTAEVSKPGLEVATVSAPQDAVEKVKSNRERNLAVVAELQSDLEELVKQLRTGILKIERQTARGTTFTSGPNLRDRVELINYAKGIQELSYRALGDTVSESAGSGIGPASGTITLVLPAIIAKPRNNRSDEHELEDADTIELNNAPHNQETLDAETFPASVRVLPPGDEENE